MVYDLWVLMSKQSIAFVLNFPATSRNERRVTIQYGRVWYIYGVVEVADLKIALARYLSGFTGSSYLRPYFRILMNFSNEHCSFFSSFLGSVWLRRWRNELFYRRACSHHYPGQFLFTPFCPCPALNTPLCDFDFLTSITSLRAAQPHSLPLCPLPPTPPPDVSMRVAAIVVQTSVSARLWG